MRLSRETIYQIIVAVHKGDVRSVVAERFSVDPATIDYHVERFEEKYGSTAAIYSLVPSEQRGCCHPSLKCLVCGKAQDNIRRKEIEDITHLKRALDAANAKLERLGYEPVEVGRL